MVYITINAVYKQRVAPKYKFLVISLLFLVLLCGISLCFLFTMSAAMVKMNAIYACNFFILNEELRTNEL
jgi:hypothetical protein